MVLLTASCQQGWGVGRHFAQRPLATGHKLLGSVLLTTGTSPHRESKESRPEVCRLRVVMWCSLEGGGQKLNILLPLPLP